MAEIAITREDTATGGRYVAVVDRLESEMTFTWSHDPKSMIIDHTGVPSALSGRGIGLALVSRAVKDARAEGFRIVPHCSFVRVTLARHKDWQDVLGAEA